VNTILRIPYYNQYGVYCCSDSDSRAQWPHCRDLEPFTLDHSVHYMDPDWTFINYRITHRERKKGRKITNSEEKRKHTTVAIKINRKESTQSKNGIHYLKEKKDVERNEAIDMWTSKRENRLLFVVFSLSVNYPCTKYWIMCSIASIPSRNT